MGRAAQTQARLVDQRARGRATQALITNHRAEYDQLYEAYKAEAEAEVAALQVAAATAGAHDHGTPQPVRLKPGRRKAHEDVVDRIDVARCTVCVLFHDRGHRCPSCGRVPSAPAPYLDAAGKAREAKRLHDAGTKVEIIATTLRITPDHVHRLLEEP